MLQKNKSQNKNIKNNRNDTYYYYNLNKYFKNKYQSNIL